MGSHGCPSPCRFDRPLRQIRNPRCIPPLPNVALIRLAPITSATSNGTRHSNVNLSDAGTIAFSNLDPAKKRFSQMPLESEPVKPIRWGRNRTQPFGSTRPGRPTRTPSRSEPYSVPTVERTMVQTMDNRGLVAWCRNRSGKADPLSAARTEFIIGASSIKSEDGS